MSVARKLMGVTKAVREGWDLSNAAFNGTPPFGKFGVAGQDGSPQDVFFKPDGTKMYVIGITTDTVYEYNLSVAWEVATASYLQNFSVAAQELSPSGIFFKPDGTKMYVTGSTGDDVNEYDLSTAWDVSTASYLQNFSFAAQESFPAGIFFKPDGLKMYVIGASGRDVNEFDLSTAWNVTTASFLQTRSISLQESTPTGVSFKPDGTKMYVIGSSGDAVYEYNLSTAWDVSTTSFLQSFSVADRDSLPTGVFFKPDGTKMYTIGTTTDTVYEHNLSTAWDVSTAAWVTPTDHYFSVFAQDIAPNGLFFKPDGTKMYVLGDIGDAVYEYNLSTAWDISTASYLQTFSVAAQEGFPTGIFFKPDGTKMYITGTAGDDVNEYNLNTAWDISTAVYLQAFSVAAQESQPQDVFFKPDGTIMYIIGSLGDAVRGYNLSTAWDVSTASLAQTFSVSFQETFPTGLFFKPDGTKMYVIGTTGDDVNEYNLSTAWNVTTASYLQNFSVLDQETNPQGIFFRHDGLKMYVIGASGDAVYEYDL